MKKMLLIATLAIGSWISAALAADTYQVTGPVLEVTPTSITVQKDKEKWQIARDASTTAKGDVKVGDKVTVKYRMTATSIEVKDAKKK